jgi:hypothetical protein
LLIFNTSTGPGVSFSQTVPVSPGVYIQAQHVARGRHAAAIAFLCRCGVFTYKETKRRKRALEALYKIDISGAARAWRRCR